MTEVVWWVLRHRLHGVGGTFLTAEEAGEMRRRVAADEPGWSRDLWVEAFRLGVDDVAERALLGALRASS